MRIKDTLARLDVRASKARGQNFLIDESVVTHIFDQGAILPNTAQPIIEIGPGLGALTELLVNTGNPVTVIEIEEKFCDALQSKFPTLTIVNQDVRTVDFSSFGSNLIVYGNLPYSFSTEILFHLIEHRAVISRAVLMLQKEFVERMAAAPGSKTYGALSVGAQLFCDLTMGNVVPGNSFHPPTQVASRVVTLSFIPEGKYPVQDYAWFRKVVKASFLQRRKKIVNSLRASGLLQGKEPLIRIMQVFETLGFDPLRRAETFAIEEFVQLADALYEVRGA
jgi:16S rRNA (adenine1518-N6/adenine1519-N6)-dimethyltransferase